MKRGKGKEEECKLKVSAVITRFINYNLLSRTHFIVYLKNSINPCL